LTIVATLTVRRERERYGCRRAALPPTDHAAVTASAIVNVNCLALFFHRRTLDTLYEAEALAAKLINAYQAGIRDDLGLSIVAAVLRMQRAQQRVHTEPIDGCPLSRHSHSFK
jgi:hypothetical protein